MTIWRSYLETYTVVTSGVSLDSIISPTDVYDTDTPIDATIQSNVSVFLSIDA